MNHLKTTSQSIDASHDIIHIGAASGTTTLPAERYATYDMEDMGHAENNTPEMTGCLSIEHKAKIGNFDANCERLFGFKRSEVINRNVSLLMPTAYALEHDACLTRYLCGGEPCIIGCGCEIIAQRKDGLIFPIWLAIHEDSSAEKPRFIGHIKTINAQRIARATQANIQNWLARLFPHN